MTNFGVEIPGESGRLNGGFPFIAHTVLEELYAKYNRREFVHPDPLEFLYGYPDPADREIVGLIASSLAYGAVRQILKNVRNVLDRIGEPSKFLNNASRPELDKTFSDFKYRFTTGEELSSLLYGASRVIRKHGSLQGCFVRGQTENDVNTVPALCFLVDEIQAEAGRELGHLLPHPGRKSACKRLNLYLRWMVREDDVDPGGWYTVPPGRLLVPIDVHMYRICMALGLTVRKSANLQTAIEITEEFRKVSPDDPVKYDFAITRLGIRDELEPSGFINECVGNCDNSNNNPAQRIRGKEE